MDFQVSARKWRPQKFTELIGQEHIVRTLSNAIKLDRISHSYLFSGTRGVGKTTTARILAKALNCEQ
jgi:DNA polymerase-3 subunit gamma/tau